MLEAVTVLAIEIARGGREGRKIGTLFVVSDTGRTMGNSRCLMLDPLLHHRDEEPAQLDGAFIVSDHGIVFSASRYINASSDHVTLPLGLGSRHMAAASIPPGRPARRRSLCWKARSSGYSTTERSSQRSCPNCGCPAISASTLARPYSRHPDHDMSVFTKSGVHGSAEDRAREMQ